MELSRRMTGGCIQIVVPRQIRPFLDREHCSCQATYQYWLAALIRICGYEAADVSNLMTNDNGVIAVSSAQLSPHTYRYRQQTRCLHSGYPNSAAFRLKMCTLIDTLRPLRIYVSWSHSAALQIRAQRVETYLWKRWYPLALIHSENSPGLEGSIIVGDRISSTALHCDSQLWTVAVLVVAAQSGRFADKMYLDFAGGVPNYIQQNTKAMMIRNKSA
ncbi:hypothetical protein EDD18DRAFT_541054 [Armillaria luteobubalina]|uniref:Uncharacterized protein n=1 Tax=Armillaria luteobubalina TaxID=153913 RepID=A0AA39PY08_9AGAR|nr:hypothetical protein EDD18DRAFT_541054 [Armillaria luteobubalina]